MSERELIKQNKGDDISGGRELAAKPLGEGGRAMNTHDRLQADVDNRGRQWDEASRELDKARRQWGEADRKWDEARRQLDEARRERDEAGRQWDEAGRQLCRAGRWWDEAVIALDSKKANEEGR